MLAGVSFQMGTPPPFSSRSEFRILTPSYSGPRRLRSPRVRVHPALRV